MKETLQEIKEALGRHKLPVLFVVVMSSTVIMFMYFVTTSIDQGRTEVAKVPPKKALDKEETPDGFLRPQGVRAKTKTVVKEKEPEPEPEPPAPDPYKSFERIKKDKGPSESEILRRKLQKKRSGQLDMAYLPQDAEGIQSNTESVWEDQSREEDYSSHDMPETTPTYPVDLSRTLTADKIIPAVLVTQIHSAIPSEKVIAQVEQNVYASHGRKILIPRGSRAIGEYQPLEKEGQERLQLAWKRIITPEGINIRLNAEVADAYGQAGLTGEVDRRFFDRYGNAMLLASVSAASQLTIGTQSEAAANATESFSNEFGTLTEEIIQQNLDIRPRVTIKRGTRINISPVTDIWFKEPKRGRIDVTPIDKVKNFQQPRDQQMEASYEIR